MLDSVVYDHYTRMFPFSPRRLLYSETDYTPASPLLPPSITNLPLLSPPWYALPVEAWQTCRIGYNCIEAGVSALISVQDACL
jgi:hypothetical protein